MYNRLGALFAARMNTSKRGQDYIQVNRSTREESKKVVEQS